MHFQTSIDDPEETPRVNSKSSFPVLALNSDDVTIKVVPPTPPWARPSGYHWLICVIVVMEKDGNEWPKQ